MQEILVLTNNRLVKDSYGAVVSYIEGPSTAVVESALEHVLKGRRLLTSPLPPNAALMESPFRTIVLSMYVLEGVSARDVMLTGRALEKTRGCQRKKRRVDEARVVKDYAFIDLDHLRALLEE